MMTELFTPAKIGNCEIPNRLIVPAMVMNLCGHEPVHRRRNDHRTVYQVYRRESQRRLGHDHHRRLCSKCEREGL